ncbi:MAG: hypothetical protein KF773_09180 [Deltaproteobacteria bacterium]|nr:hypothetical protein [Deltaproteobacteria bacterium]MCW5804967.1 hypothetical protein [Deltaproteobacteria bacterium]
MQRYLKFAVAGLSLVGVILGFAYKLTSYGGHGIAVLAACIVPAGLTGLFIAKPPMPRWAAIVSALSLLLAAMKTSGDDTDLNNIMMAAFGGMIAAVVLAIKPERPR